MTNRQPPPPRFEDHRPRREGPPPGGPGGPRRPGGPRPPGRRPPPRRGSPQQASGGFGIGRILLYVLLGVIGLISAGFAYLMIAPPTDLIRQQAIAQVKESTGRTLSIAGKTGLTFYPSIGVSMGKVSLSAPPGMSAPPTVTMDRLTVAVKLLPLLGSEIRVDRFILENPVFDLRVDKSGAKSWDFAGFGAQPAAPVRIAQAATELGRYGLARDWLPDESGRRFLHLAQAARGAGSADLSALENLSLGDVRIVNGVLNYTDEAAGTRERVTAINVALALDQIAKPLKAEGDLNWKGEKLAFEATLNSPKQLLRNERGKLTVTFAARPISGGYDGSIKLGDALDLDGAVSAQADSVRKLAGWFGTTLPKASGFGPMSIKGRLRATGPVYDLRSANIGLDGATATGKVSVRTNGARPHVNADLTVSELDLNKYMAGGASGAAPRSSGQSGGASSPPASTGGGSGGEPRSIEDLLKRDDGTRVRGYTQRTGWSNETIDLAALGFVDVDAKLNVARLLWKNIKVGRSLLDVALKDATMRANLSDMQLYGGRGRGIVMIDASAPRASQVSANFAIDGVSAQPLLTDAAEIEWLSGKGDLKIAVTARGATERQFVEALGGDVDFIFRDGAITGFNISKSIRALQQGRIGDLSSASREKTDFSEMTATFKIINGIARNDDLRLLSPLLRVGGSGEVRLPPRQVDYTVRPKLVAALEGQGGDTGLSGLEIPVRIHGSLDDPQYTPDLGGIVSDPSKAVDAVKRIGEQFKGKNAGEIIDGLFGGGGGSEGAGSDGGSDGRKIDGKKLLDGLFGR